MFVISEREGVVYSAISLSCYRVHRVVAQQFMHEDNLIPKSKGSRPKYAVHKAAGVCLLTFRIIEQN